MALLFFSSPLQGLFWDDFLEEKFAEDILELISFLMKESCIVKISFLAFLFLSSILDAIGWRWYDWNYGSHNVTMGWQTWGENKHMENEGLEQWKKPVSFVPSLNSQNHPAIASLQNS